jgi:hypothetical protein
MNLAANRGRCRIGGGFTEGSGFDGEYFADRGLLGYEFC